MKIILKENSRLLIVEQVYPNTIETLNTYGLLNKEVEIDVFFDVLSRDVLFYVIDEDELYDLAQNFYYDNEETDPVKELIKFKSHMEEINNSFVSAVLSCVEIVKEISLHD
jgi:hypothetical protein